MKQTAVEFLIEEMQRRIPPFYAHYVMDMDEVYEQSKEMEKEKMCSFAEFVATYPDKNENINGEMLHAKSKYDGAERTIDLLETFKSE